MASTWESVKDFYVWALENGDGRTDPWLLVYSPIPIILIFAAYLLLVALGPRLMEGREPFTLRSVLLVYNICLVGLSVYMFYEFLVTSVLAGYSYFCQPVDYSNSELGLRMARVCWWFFFSKVIELLDTIFFIMRKKFNQISFLHVYHHATMIFNWWAGVKYVAGGQDPVCGDRFPLRLQPLHRLSVSRWVQWGGLCLYHFPPHPIPQLLLPDLPPPASQEEAIFFIMRKKFNQISFLHVYHHATMIFNWWAGVKYVAGGQAFFIGMLNSFVHIFMYLYYALAVLGPSVQKYLWWKRYLTLLQLTQFVAIAFHSGYNLFTDCPFPDGFNGVVFAYIISLLILFLNFYYQTYLRRPRKKKL